MLTRRGLMFGLLASATASCLPKRSLLSDLPTGVRLGWRFVPGQVLAYQLRTTHAQAEAPSTRVERWRFQVVDLVDPVATLRADLIASTDPADRAHPVATRMRLGRDGRVTPMIAPDCSAVGVGLRGCFSDHLASRMLALALPHRAVRPGDRWDDPQQTEPFVPVLPDGLDAAPRARCSVADIYRVESGEIRVDIQTDTELRTADGPALSATGTATWDPVRGLLRSRRVRVDLLGAGPDPGALDLHLTFDPRPLQ